jgi:hypothetical protein
MALGVQRDMWSEMDTDLRLLGYREAAEALGVHIISGDRHIDRRSL